jgi:hypothetical protein
MQSMMAMLPAAMAQFDALTEQIKSGAVPAAQAAQQIAASMAMFQNVGGASGAAPASEGSPATGPQPPGRGGNGNPTRTPPGRETPDNSKTAEPSEKEGSNSDDEGG